MLRQALLALSDSRQARDLIMATPLTRDVVARFVAGFRFEIAFDHACFPPWKLSSASENNRASSFRPGAGTCAFSTRVSDVPERVETMNSEGTLTPRALARISTCFGERIVSLTTSSRKRPSGYHPEG